MRLIFVRHAETTANAEDRFQGHADFSLSARGQAQALLLQSRFLVEGLTPTHLYSSPLKRCAETAEIIASSWPAVQYWEDLQEHDVGVLSGLTWDEAIARYPEIDRDLEVSRQFAGIEGAEPLQDRRERGRRVAEGLLARHSDGDVVVAVSHGGILQHILSGLLGADRVWGLSISNTAVFEFELDPARWSMDGETRLTTAQNRIVRFNDAAHLG
jgi:broad specificity phosphatase PhoE